MLTGCLENNMRKQCKQCKEAFDAKDEFDLFCSKECKEEALAELDSDLTSVCHVNKKTINDIGRGVRADAYEDGCQFDWSCRNRHLGLFWFD